MKKLSKTLAIALVVMMCMSLMPARGLAQTNDPPTPVDGVVIINPDPNNPPIVGPNLPTPVTPEPQADDPSVFYGDEPHKRGLIRNEEELILKIVLRVGNKDLEKYLNDVKKIIKMDVAPYIKEGRTMVAIRYLAEALEMRVAWDEETRTVLLEDEKFKIEIPVDTKKIIVNGEARESDVMPEINSGRTMLPIANIARALGLEDGVDIFWDTVEKKASIIRVLKAK